MVEYLLDKGANPHARGGSDNESALHIAAHRGKLEIMKKIIEKGTDVNIITGWAGNNTPLHFATKSRNFDIVKYLIEKGANVNAENRRGDTPLHNITHYSSLSSSEEGDTILDIVKYLVEKGANINFANRKGWTPLKFSAMSGRLDAIKYLMEKGADLHSKDNRDILHKAVNHLDVIEYLVEKGANINTKDNDGRTPLHFDAMNTDIKVAKYLIEKGAEINSKDNYGNTPLHIVSSRLDMSGYVKGYLKKIKYLVKKGADLSAEDDDNTTPRDILEEYDNPIITEYLCTYLGISRNHCDTSSNSWVNNRVINFLKSFTSSMEYPALLTSRNHTDHGVTVVPEINSNLVNGTLMLGILATGLFYKTQHTKPNYQKPLSQEEQLLRLNNIDEDKVRMIKNAIQPGKDRWGNPETNMDRVKISSNKTSKHR